MAVKTHTATTTNTNIATTSTTTTITSITNTTTTITTSNFESSTASVAFLYVVVYKLAPLKFFKSLPHNTWLDGLWNRPLLIDLNAAQRFVLT